MYRKKGFVCTLNYVASLYYVQFMFTVGENESPQWFPSIHIVRLSCNIQEEGFLASCMYSHFAASKLCCTLKFMWYCTRGRLNSHLCRIYNYDVLYRRKNSELYVNQAKVSLVLPVTTDTGNKQFLYLIGNFIKEILGLQCASFLVTIFASKDAIFSTLFNFKFIRLFCLHWWMSKTNEKRDFSTYFFQL